MFLKRIKNKRFEYIPRFYKPEKDIEERRKRKLGFRNFRKYNRRGAGSVIIWIIAIIIIFWFIIKIGR